MSEHGIHVRPRLVFCDLDGTLLSRDKRLSKKTCMLLARLPEEGIELIPCTGRSIVGIPRKVLELARVRYAITADGATIYGPGQIPGEFERLLTFKIPIDEAVDLIELVRSTRSYIDLFSDGDAYVERGELDKLTRLGVSPADVAYIRSVRHELDMSLPEFLGTGRVVERLTVFYANTDLRDQVNAYVRSCGDLASYSSLSTNIEIVNSRASKGAALQWLCELLEVDIGDSIAFGDSMNDVSMLETAGLGVAMRNAQPEVQARADVVSLLDCDHAGMAAYMEKLLAS